MTPSSWGGMHQCQSATSLTSSCQTIAYPMRWSSLTITHCSKVCSQQWRHTRILLLHQAMPRNPDHWSGPVLRHPYHQCCHPHSHAVEHLPNQGIQDMGGNAKQDLPYARGFRPQGIHVRFDGEHPRKHHRTAWIRGSPEHVQHSGQQHHQQRHGQQRHNSHTDCRGRHHRQHTW